MKYKVKAGCTIYHADKRYDEGEEVELDEKLALHHAPNIEVADGEIGEQGDRSTWGQGDDVFGES
jgi:hypothetical protein